MDDFASPDDSYNNKENIRRTRLLSGRHVGICTANQLGATWRLRLMKRVELMEWVGFGLRALAPAGSSPDATCEVACVPGNARPVLLERRARGNDVMGATKEETGPVVSSCTNTTWSRCVDTYREVM